MFKVYLQREGEAGMELILPAAAEEFKVAFTWLQHKEPAGNAENQVFASFPSLKECLYQIPCQEKELEELNFLARRIEGMTDSQRERFGAAVTLRKPDTLADMVNLSCSMAHFRFYPRLLTEYELGEYIIMEDEGEMQVNQEGLSEYEEVGQRYLQNHTGCFMQGGYLGLTEEPAEVFYDGKQLPDPDYENTSPLMVTIPYKRTFHTLYLPATDANLHFWKEKLGVGSLEDFQDFFIRNNKEGMEGLKERVPCGSSLVELNQLAAMLKTELNSEEKQRLCFAAFEAEAPACVEEAIRIVKDLEAYRFLPESASPAGDTHKDRQEGAVQTAYGLVGNKYHPVSFSGEVETFRFFSPLSAEFFADCWGYPEGMPQKWYPYQLTAYEEEIREALGREHLEEEGDRGLAIYLHHKLLERKVYSMQPSVESWNGELWGVLEVQTFGMLSRGELEELKAEWRGQCSDGFGEGFEQRPVMIEDGELYISFWNPYSFQIQTEQELKREQEQATGIQMGGP